MVLGGKMLDDKIIMSGVEPHSGQHQSIHNELSLLLDEAPSDSCIKFKFLNEAEGPVSIIKIYSQQGQFVASISKALEPDVSCLELCQELRKQLGKWRANRFKSAS